MENLIEIHGHSGNTEVVYGLPPCEEDAEKPRKGRTKRFLAP